MGITSVRSGRNVHEIASGLYRISTPVPVGGVPDGFTLHQ